MWVLALASAPILIPALLAGLITGMIQAATSINEQTLSFVPKLIVVAVSLAVFGSLILGLLCDFTLGIFERIGLRPAGEHRRLAGRRRCGLAFDGAHDDQRFNGMLGNKRADLRVVQRLQPVGGDQHDVTGLKRLESGKAFVVIEGIAEQRVEQLIAS
eukprot:gene29930-33775_t